MFTVSRCLSPSPAFTEFPRQAIEQSVPARFEQQVADAPDRLAIGGRSSRLSYAELDAAANRTAAALLSESAVVGERVALLLGHDAPLIVAILGALKAGKVYVPLDPTHPAARQQSILEDTDCSVILTDTQNRAQVSLLASSSRRVINVEALDGLSATRPSLPPLGPESMAYIVYTSGSTGAPKGIVYNHRNVLHAAMRCTNAYEISPDDRLTWLASATYNAASVDIFPALLNGASLFPFAVKEEGIGPLWGWLAANAISVYHSIPALFRHLVWSRTAEPLSALRLVRLASEPMSRHDVELHRKHFPAGCALVNVLACSEVSVYRHYFIFHDSPALPTVVPAGYSVPDMDVFILDEALRPLPAGTVGQIAVRSHCPIPGYWRRPELTDAALVTLPDLGAPPVFLTGDFGVLRPDGCLEYLGRRDARVKIRGHRVEITEIELALLDLPAIREAAVVVESAGTANQELIAYLVGHGGALPGITTIRGALRQRLPDYMIPSKFVTLDALPRTLNGKIDRGALPIPSNGRPQLAATLVAPRTAVEERLLEMWERLLNVRPIGVTDNFFELGGDSLLAARLSVELSREFGREIFYEQMLSEPTIAYTGRLIEDEISSRSASPLVALQTRGSKTPFFCVHPIEGDALCFVELARLMGSDRPFYGLQGLGIQDAQESLARIEALAAYYVEAIRQVALHGPFLLGGFSAGGTIAFEMAQQLHAAGQDVACLAILDHPASVVDYNRPRYHPSVLPELIDNLWQWFVDFRDQTSRQRRAAVQRKTRQVIQRWRSRRYRSRSPLGNVEWLFWPAEQRQFATTLYQALLNYRPEQYPGRVTLFRARRRPLLCSYDRTMGWRDLAGAGLRVQVVPGSHVRILQQPYVPVLASKLQRCLDEAERSY